MAKSTEKKQQEFKFADLKNAGDSVSGKFVEFRQNTYGVYMVLENKNSETFGVSLSTVSKGLIKTNLDKFNAGVMVTIERGEKVTGKKYYLVSISIDDVLLSNNVSLDKKNVFDLL